MCGFDNFCFSFFVFLFTSFVHRIYRYLYIIPHKLASRFRKEAATTTPWIQESLQLPPELPREIQAVQGLWQVKSGLRVRIDEDQVGGAVHGGMANCASGVRQRKPRKKRGLPREFCWLWEV